MAIFNAESSKNSRMFQAGKATASIAGLPAILIGVNVQVQRSLSPIPTLTDGIVWSAQPVQGTLTAQSILTKKEGKDLIMQMTSVSNCDPLGISVKMGDGACDSSGITLDIRDGYCNGVTFAVNGQQGYIGSDFTVQFTQCNLI